MIFNRYLFLKKIDKLVYTKKQADYLEYLLRNKDDIVLINNFVNFNDSLLEEKNKFYLFNFFEKEENFNTEELKEMLYSSLFYYNKKNIFLFLDLIKNLYSILKVKIIFYLKKYIKNERVPLLIMYVDIFTYIIVAKLFLFKKELNVYQYGVIKNIIKGYPDDEVNKIVSIFSKFNNLDDIFIHMCEVYIFENTLDLFKIKGITFHIRNILKEIDKIYISYLSRIEKYPNTLSIFQINAFTKLFLLINLKIDKNSINFYKENNQLLLKFYKHILK